MSRIINQILAFHVGKPLGFDDEHIHPDMTLESLGADSLDCVEICMDIEEKFSILITDEELDAIVTVKDVYDLVDRKQKEKPSNDHLNMEKPKDENTA